MSVDRKQLNKYMNLSGKMSYGLSACVVNTQS